VWDVPQPIDANLYSHSAGHVDHYVQLGEQLNLGSDPIGSSIGITQYSHPERKAGYDMDYFVPNFGVDQDIKDMAKNLASTEEALSHKFVPKLKEDPHDTDYKVPNFGVDRDIKDSFESLNNTEDKLDYKWKVDLKKKD